MSKPSKPSRMYLSRSRREQSQQQLQRRVSDDIQQIRAERRQQKRHLAASLVMLTVALTAVLIAGNGDSDQTARSIASATVSQRNDRVVGALARHPVQTVVGNAQRMFTLPQVTTQATDVVMLTDCPAAPKLQGARAVSYEHSSFAYVMTTDAAASKQHCSLRAVRAAYGRPTSIIVTDGSLERPREMVLFYDQGIRRRPPVAQPKATAIAPDMSVYNGAVRQLAIPSLPPSACPGHDTIVQIVAHEDDDILFMNPDLLHAIQQGNCIRSVFLTAGDAGYSQYYWLSRERGAEAAYASLTGLEDIWTHQTVRLGEQQYATVATLQANTAISLLFFHLPDGGVGHGFTATGNESLEKLVAGEDRTLQTVDQESTYTYDQLVDALKKVLYAYQPTELRTQRPYNTSAVFTDHSDHMTTGKLATAAFDAFRVDNPSTRLAYYTGYPIRELPPNVAGDDLNSKQQAFFAYGGYDPFVCTSVDVCTARGDYGDYLTRQYRTDP